MRNSGCALRTEKRRSRMRRRARAEGMGLIVAALAASRGAGCKRAYQPVVTASGAITATADDLRTGWYPNQPGLSPALVGGPTFGRLWRTALPLTAGEQVFAQPLVRNGTVLIVTEAND